MEEVVNELKEIAENLASPSITDWLMFVITVIYVVATIVICVSNYKSAKAAREQLDEARTQLEEGKKYQAQNAGIQLYEMRKKVLEKLAEEDIDLETDIELLFEKSILETYKKLRKYIINYRSACGDLQTFENHLKESEEDYNEYLRLQNLSEQYSDDKELITYASKFDYYTNDTYDGERKVYYFLDITNDISKNYELKNNIRNNLIELMKAYIKNSIFQN